MSMPAGGRRHGARAGSDRGLRPCWRSAPQTGAHRRDRGRGWPMICDLVAVGTRAWQAGASKAGRALSTPGLFVASRDPINGSVVDGFHENVG